MKMKRTFSIIVFASLLICLFSCENDDSVNNDFYATNLRVGLWINSEKKDTLEFVNNTKLIRKGSVYKYEEYLYRIEGDKLLISDLNSTVETQHTILKASRDNVTLENMYPTVGMTSNSGTFIKKQ